MSDYPHLHALLVRLLKLDEVDAQLPIPVLVNLNRRQLRGPLLGLADMAEEFLRESNSDWDEPEDLATSALGELEAVLDKRYPSLAEGEIFRSPLLSTQAVAYLNLDPIEGCPELAEQSVMVREALRLYEDDWRCYQPVASLHRLTWQLPAGVFGQLLVFTEAELSLDPAVSEIILDMAARWHQ